MKLEKKTIIWSAISVVVFTMIGIILWNVFKTEEPKLSKETQQLKGFTASVLASVNKYDPNEYSADTMKKELIETVTLAQVKYKSDSVGVSTLNIMDEINGLTGTSEEILNETKTFIENFDVEGLVNKIEGANAKPTKVLTLRANTVCDTETIDDKYCLDGNNSKLSANVYVHDEESTKWVVLLHPFMTNGSIMYGALGDAYKELGYNVLAPDSRGFGNSSGKVAMGYLESLDTYDWLLDLHYNYEKRYGVKNQPDTIIIHGISLGAATTLQLATNPDIAASEDNLTKLGVKVFYDDGGYTSMSGLIEDILTNQDMGSLAVILSSLGVDFEDFMKNLQTTLKSLGITGLEDFDIDNIADMEEFFNEVTDFVNYIKTADIKGVSDLPADIKEKLKKYLPEDIYNSVFNTTNIISQNNKAITNTYGAFNFGSYVDKGVSTAVTNTVDTGLNSVNYSKYSNSFSAGRTFPTGTKVVVTKNENDTTISPSNADTVVENAGENLYYQNTTSNISSTSTLLQSSGSATKSATAASGAVQCANSGNCDTTNITENANPTGCNVPYKTAQKMIQESMRAYYNRGSYLQYNTAKHAGINNGYVLPEEATSQDNRYLVCSGFVHASMNTAFGIAGKDKSGESVEIQQGKKNDRTTFDSTANLLKYAKNNWKAGKLKERNKIIFYGTKNNSSLEFEDLVKVIKPGDIFVYTGHTMLAYDIIEVNGKKDVLLLHSWQGPYVKTRLDGTYRISYNNFPPNIKTDSFGAINNYIPELASINQGTVKQALLSRFTDRFINKNNGKIQCQVAECAVIRPFYEDANGNAAFNFTTTNDSCAKTQLRMQYPNIKIEKTSSIGDKNVVSPGEIITYTIKVTNNNASDVSYINFNIEESLNENVELESDSITSKGAENVTYSNKKIKWFVSELGATKTVTFTYQVNVNGNVGKTIKSTGNFYYNENGPSIKVGTIENKIVQNQSKTKWTYEACYNKHKDKGKKGLALIEATYNCATETTLYNFSEFNIEDIKDKKPGLIYTKDTEKKGRYIVELNSNYPYSKMVLNNYWNGIVKDTIKNNGQEDWESNSKDKYYLPKWTACTYKTSDGETTDKQKCIYHQSSRAKTINSNDFKEGDILIYKMAENKDTLEIGIYAYIYINGKFVGVNKSGLQARNEFYQTYYARENWTSTKQGEYLSIENLYQTDLWKNKNYITSMEKKIINYQTLFGKDYYVILRPSLITTEEWRKLVNAK